MAVVQHGGQQGLPGGFHEGVWLSCLCFCSVVLRQCEHRVLGIESVHNWRVFVSTAPKQNMQGKLVPLLETGVKVLIYAGDADFICNW